MQEIQMVDLLGQYQHIKSEVDRSVLHAIQETAYINGPQVKEFAKALATYTQVKHVIPCANGTDALQIALMGLGLQPGDEVIVPTFTYVASAEVIALLQLKPIFVDVYPDTFTINVEQVREKITPRTKAIMPVHLYGQCAHMEPLLAVAKEHEIFIIEDTAQAIGTDYLFTDGTSEKAGAIGDIGATSFFPSKNLGCFGDGGAMLSQKDELAESLRMIANHGQKIKYYHDTIGVNSRLDTIQAAVLQVKLQHLKQYTQNRQAAAKFYDEAFRGNEQIATPKRATYSTHVFHQYTLKVKERDQLKAFLAEKNIPSMVYYPVPLHLQKAYTSWGYKEGDFPVAEQLCQEVISLPMHTELTEEQLQYISEHVLAFFKK